MLKIAVYSAAFSLLALAAGRPATPQSSTTTPPSSAAAKSHSATALSDSAFAKKAAEGGLAEVKFGQLAEERGSSTAVKDFGKRMVADHSKADEQLQNDAAKEKVTLPANMNKTDQATYDRLSKLSGSAFDRAYARDMVRDHKADIAEFEHESQHGQQQWTKDFASQTLPTLRDHLKQAEEMLQTVEQTKAPKS